MLRSRLFPTLLLTAICLTFSSIVHAVIPPEELGYPPQAGPLITSSWGQRAPYNYMCPLTSPTPWGGYQPDEDHCRVGCVAVAIGQIMRYHRWPLEGDGTASVVYPLASADSHTFTVDFSQASYDYDAMLDDYSSTEYTEREGRAVAELLYHCAVASQMIFGQSASATTNFATAEALGRNFRYDTSLIETKIRYLYTERQWMDMVYRELSEGRPIFYEAIDLSLTRGSYAHSFVVDGYREDGYVHVNWGWNGQQDGYYDIAQLNPDGYRFNFYQDMTIGIRSPQAEPESILPPPSTIHHQPSTIYTLDGRRMSSREALPPGIYVSGGRKFVVR